MNALKCAARQVFQAHSLLPFSVYSSVKEQKIFSVPIFRPLLIVILEGSKKLGREENTTCEAGSFVFLFDHAGIDMRNIPDSSEYFAVLIEFEFGDFDCFKHKAPRSAAFVQGPMDATLHHTLQQFVEWSAFANPAMWSLRRREILQLLYLSGYEEVSAVVASASLGHRLHGMISDEIASDHDADYWAGKLAISESTLRRKLRSEGTTLQEIKDKAKLGLGLHLVQTSLEPIGRIAERCGYLSQSRFTDKFKQMFGITPTALRKTRLSDSGE